MCNARMLICFVGRCCSSIVVRTGGTFTAVVPLIRTGFGRWIDGTRACLEFLFFQFKIIVFLKRKSRKELLKLVKSERIGDLCRIPQTKGNILIFNLKSDFKLI